MVHQNIRRIRLGAPRILAALGAAIFFALPALMGTVVLANDTPLIRFDVESHLDLAPLMVIMPDGTVLYRGRDGAQHKAETAMSEDARSALVARLLDLGFPDMDEATIRDEIDLRKAAKGGLFKIADGGVTRIALSLPEGSNEVALESPGLTARAFPGIDALERFREAEILLLQIFTSYQSGS